eukprot:CAMPEP_0171147326 /NCGR_PEP_ID=MMETSP0766_2-20121228/148012_1 /TAXON_ID=439317 /ORGANISM="Gambierdiscus australes, Strain CAWD 149" /LENGTH=115 /DNA_ID=CAMNT_0011611235 /DNA_START=622 /DNA_END=966 /DNA_ORIENTATION=+
MPAVDAQHPARVFREAHPAMVRLHLGEHHLPMALGTKDLCRSGGSLSDGHRRLEDYPEALRPRALAPLRGSEKRRLPERLEKPISAAEVSADNPRRPTRAFTLDSHKAIKGLLGA